MGVWARNSKFSGFHCRVSEKKIGEINLFHLENIYLWQRSMQSLCLTVQVLALLEEEPLWKNYSL